MISQRSFTYLSYVILAIMAASLLLVALRLVPRSWYEYMFAAVLGLFLFRMALRLILARKARLAAAEGEKPAGEKPPAG
jgi:uncharacterized membrane protein YfcA